MLTIHKDFVLKATPARVFDALTITARPIVLKRCVEEVRQSSMTKGPGDA